MPIHEYQCKSCLREFEELVFKDEVPTCPHCHAANTEKLVSRPCACRGSREGGDDGASGTSAGGGCGGCAGGSCSTCGH